MMLKIRSRQISRTVSIVARTLLAGAMIVLVGCNENVPPAGTNGTDAHTGTPKSIDTSINATTGNTATDPIPVNVATHVKPLIDLNPVSSGDAVIATVNGKPVTREQLTGPLIESYGLNYLLQLIQLELADQNAKKLGITIGPEDIQAESDIMVKGFFPEAEPGDYKNLLGQLLTQQNITRSQWQLLLQINSRLRRIAEPMCRGRITDENLKQAFDIHYGALAKIRIIQVSRTEEALAVKQRLATGDKFEDVAKELSRDKRTAALGGEFPAFPSNSTNVNSLIRDTAFGMKPGEVSDPLNTEGQLFIIKLEERQAPRIAKFDDATKNNLRKLLTDRLIVDQMKFLKAQLGVEAQQQGVLMITDPVLKMQFDDKVKEHEAAVKREEEERKARSRPAVESDLRNRIFGKPRPDTQPTTLPVTAIPGDKQPTSPSEAPYRPPATKSGVESKTAPDGNKK